MECGDNNEIERSGLLLAGGALFGLLAAGT